MWFSLALLSALLLAVRRIYEKDLTVRFGNYSLAFVLQVFSIAPILVLFLFLPIPDDIKQLPWQFWWPLLIIWVVLYPAQTYFLYRSLREGELSQVTPAAALLPVFNIATSFLIIHELPTRIGMVGIIATVLGTYLLLRDVRRGEGQRYNRPVLFMLVVMMCWAIGSTLDKVAVEVSTPVFYSFVNMTGASFIALVLTYAFRQQSELKQVRELFWTLLLLGILFAIAFVAFMSAFALDPTSYTLAIRSAGFLLASAWGIFLLKESLSMRKILALALFTMGTIALAIA